jgi:hypothetical protein
MTGRILVSDLLRLMPRVSGGRRFRLAGASGGSTAANTRHRNRVRFTNAGQNSAVGMHAAAASQTVLFNRFAILMEQRR